MYLLISTEFNNQFAVAVGKKVIEKKKIVRKPYRQSELLLKTISILVKQEALSGIMVVQGPGEFAALRIGIATANALAYSKNIPVVGVCLKRKWERLNEEIRLNNIWQEGVKLMKLAELQKWVVPYYDKDPNISNRKVSK